MGELCGQPNESEDEDGGSVRLEHVVSVLGSLLHSKKSPSEGTKTKLVELAEVLVRDHSEKEFKSVFVHMPDYSVHELELGKDYFIFGTLVFDKNLVPFASEYFTTEEEATRRMACLYMSAVKILHLQINSRCDQVRLQDLINSTEALMVHPLEGKEYRIDVSKYHDKALIADYAHVCSVFKEE